MAIGTTKRLIHAGAIVLAMSPVSAVTQSAPMMQTVPVTYTGLAMDWFADSIRIVQPDGSLAEYRGPMPNIPVAPGDVVSFAFEVRQPIGIQVDNATYDGQVSATGTYKISVNQNVDGGDGSWGMIGGGQLGGDPAMPGTATSPLKASYSVGYDSGSGSTTVESGSLPSGPTGSGSSSGGGSGRRGGSGGVVEQPLPVVEPLVEPVVEPLELVEPKISVEQAAVQAPSNTSLPFAPDKPKAAGAGGGGGGGPVQPIHVPAPGMLWLFAMFAALLPLRRKFARS